MIEVSVIWGGVVVLIALLAKHELMAKRAAIEDRYDNELAAVGKALQSLEDNTAHVSVFVERFEDRLAKLERQVNDAQIAKTLGRR